VGMFRDMAKQALGPALMAVHGESCTAHLPTGGTAIVMARPVDAKLVGNPTFRKQAQTHKLVLQVAREELPAVVKHKTLITLPGEWVESSDTTVKWMVAGVIEHTASPAHWFLAMSLR